MLKPERKALLDSLVEEGVTIRDLHKKHGFNYKTVRKYYPGYRKHVGKKQNGQHDVAEVLEEHKDLIAEMAAERAPGNVIAQAVNISPETLKKHRPELIWTKREAGSFGGMVSQLGRLGGL